MITSILKTVALAAGCNQVFYESKQLSNIITGQALQGNVFCLIIQPNSVTIKTAGNGVRVVYPNYNIEIMQQVNLEDTAENNEVVFDNLMEICKAFIYELIKTGSFQKITDVSLVKIEESRYDFNPIGWSMSISLNPIINSDQC